MSEYKEIKQDAVSEPSANYYNDYEYGGTKEQLTPGLEVSKEKVYSGVIDTSTITSTVDNVYNLAVGAVNNEIFSIGVTVNSVLRKKTFEGSTYAQLEVDLQNWLGSDYVVDGDGAGNFTIYHLDGLEITFSNPNLVRNIELIGTNIHTLTDITIDGVTTQINGATYTTDAAGITYLKSQLSTSLYYMIDSGNDLIIARKDGAIPVISVVNYDRYSYTVRGSRIALRYIYSCNDIEKDYKHYVEIDGVSDEYTLASGLTYTTTSSTIVYNNITALGSFSATNCDWHGNKRVDMFYDLLDASYTKGAFYSWGTDTTTEYDKYAFDFYKNDRSSVTVTSQYATIVNSDLTTSQIGSGWYFDTTNNKTTVNITTYTETSKTATLTSNNYFVAVPQKFKKIRLAAVSSVGSSEGVYEAGTQSCTTKYSTTTTVVADKIFQTDANNHGYIIIAKRGGFVINFTTTTSNKLNFTCS